MSEIFQKILFLVDSNSRLKIIYLILIILILAIFEVLSIGAIIPFFSSILSNQDFLLINFFGNDINFTSNDKIKYSLILIFLIFLLKNIIVIFFIYFQSSFANNIRRNLSQRLYKSYLNINYEIFLKKNSSEFIKNINVECEIFRYTFFNIISSISEIIIFFFIIGFLFFYNLYFSITILAFIIIFILIYNFFLRKILKNIGTFRFQNSEKLFKHVAESLTSLKEIKILGIQNNFLNKFNFLNVKYTNNYILHEFFLNFPKVLIELIGVLLIVSFLFFNISSNIAVAELITGLGVYGLASFRLLPCLNRVLLGYNHLKLATETVNNLYLSVNQITTEKKNPTYDQLEYAKKIASVDLISIENLNFSYKDKNSFSINNFNFKIKKNSFIGLIGNSGSGKSTLLNIIAGLLKPEKGAVYFNNKLNIYDNLKYFYKKIAYVTQEINIIDDTIKNNIAFGIEKDEIDLKKLLQAIQQSKLDEFVKDLREGLETRLGDRGARLSGGQKQRIGIARALYFDPDLIIFDEATSALDFYNENSLINIINKLKGSKTIIFATHKKSLLEKCDNIIQIADNKLEIF
jgi:ABC-type bacteriocin/lantibiotic exporter with double-glycine peptidase domain